MKYRPAITSNATPVALDTNNHENAVERNGGVQIPPLTTKPMGGGVVEWRTTQKTPSQSSKKNNPKSPLGTSVLSPNRLSGGLGGSTNPRKMVRTPRSSAKKASRSSAKRQKQQQEQQEQQDRLEQIVKQYSYPQEKDIGIPSPSEIRTMYESAIAAEQESSHQKILDDMGSGLLSFSEVLLPAVALKEVKALKKVQAKVQRDVGALWKNRSGKDDDDQQDTHQNNNNSQVQAFQRCRRAVYESIADGIQAATEARYKHEQLEQERQSREKQQALQRQLEKQRLKEEQRLLKKEQRHKQRLLEKQRRHLDQKKKFPPTLDLWREVALLMNELRDLQKEEKMWKETHEQLSKREEDLARQMEEQHQRKKAQEDEESSSSSETNDKDDDTTKNMQAKVDQAVDHVTLSTVRIQKALDLVSNLVTDSDVTRKEIYNTYRKDHQFHGYRGVKDPKGLIRALTLE